MKYKLYNFVGKRYNLLKLVKSIDQISDFVIDVGDELLDLPLGVQNFN